MEQLEDTVPPLDAKLDPRKIWSDGDGLVREKKYQDAVFYHLVAFFVDFSLDALDVTLARKAVASCGQALDSEDPMTIALRLVVREERSVVNYIRACLTARQQIEQFMAKNSFAPIGQGGVKSIEELDRIQFGIAMTYVFYARISNGHEWCRRRKRSN